LIQLRKSNRAGRELLTALAIALLLGLVQSHTAHAALPRTVNVFPSSSTDGTPSKVKLAGLAKLQADYNVLLRGKKKGAAISLTGVPLLDLLKAGGANTENVQFVKIRYGTTNDSVISLLSLNQGFPARPPMILASGQRPGLGPFDTPAVVPGQPDFAEPISESHFVPFNTRHAPLTLIPGAPGAQILRVKLRAQRRKSGEFLVSARLVGGASPAAKAYDWWGFDSKGKPKKLGVTPTIETRDATRGNVTRMIFVVIYERGTGSTGVGSFSYHSRDKSG
jgi:hypothetical protein